MASTSASAPTEEAKAQAKQIVEGIVNEAGGPKQVNEGNVQKKPKKPEVGPISKGNEPPKGKVMERPTPAWIRYYDKRISDIDSNYGRGASKHFDYFDELMRQYVDDNSLFFDIVNQHPEACAIIYPDARGRIRVIHHLTTGVYGSPVVVGVDGLESMNEVKALNVTSFTEQFDIGAIDGEHIVPKLQDFTSKEFESITTDNVLRGEDGVEDERVKDFFGGYPTTYLIHPYWLKLIHEAIGKAPGEVARVLLSRLKSEFDEGRLRDYERVSDYYPEIYRLLVFLWACQADIPSIGYKRLLKTYDNLVFKKIQNGVIEHLLQETKEEPGASGMTAPSEPRSKKVRLSDPKKRSPSPTPSSSDTDLSRSDSEDSRQSIEDVPRRGRMKQRKDRGGDDGGSGSSSSSEERSPTPNRKRPSLADRRRSEERDRSRSSSRGRRKRTKRRVDQEDVYRLADQLISRKKKSIGSNLTPEQHKAFTLLSARDWYDERPKLNHRMEDILNQTRMQTAVQMMRATMRHERWLGLLPDSGITQFLQNGILATDDAIIPSGFSMFYIRPRTFDENEIESEQSRRDRLASAFGEKGMTDSAIDALAKLEFYIPRSYHDLEVMIDTGIRWLDFCTRERSIASEGLRRAEQYIRNYRREIYEIIADDPEFPTKLIHSLDRAVTFVGEKLAYRYGSIRKGRSRLKDEMVKRVKRHLEDVESGCHNFPSNAVPRRFLAAIRTPEDEGTPKAKETANKAKAPRWHTKNPSPVESWCLPTGKDYKDFFAIPSSSPMYGCSMANNFLEFLGLAINVYLMVLEATETHQCFLVLGDNTSGLGWLKKSGHMTTDSAYYEVVTFIARKVARLLIHNQHCIARQHIRGVNNEIPDLLSFTGEQRMAEGKERHPFALADTSNTDLTHAIHQYLPQLVPKSFEIRPLPTDGPMEVHHIHELPSTPGTSMDFIPFS